MPSIDEPSTPWVQLWRLTGHLALISVSLWVALLLKPVWVLLSIVVTGAYALQVPLELIELGLTSLLGSGLRQRLPTRLLSLVIMGLLSAWLVIEAGTGWWQLLKLQGHALWTDLPTLLQHYGMSSLLQYAQVFRWSRLLQNTGHWVLHSLSNGLHVVAGLIMVFYLLLDGRRLRQSLVQQLDRWPRCQALIGSTHKILQAYMREQLVAALFAGMIMAGVYWGLGFKYAALLGAVTGVCSILPVAGPWIGLTPALLLGLLSPHPEVLGWVLLWTGAVYLLKEYILLPYVLGNALEIHPALVIVTFLACVDLFGLLGGLFMAFPLASLIAAASYSRLRA